MDIKLYMSKAEEIVFVCDGVFTKPVETVVLDCERQLLSLRFENEPDLMELNCHVDYELAEHMAGQDFCTMGYMDEGKLMGATFARFETVNAVS